MSRDLRNHVGLVNNLIEAIKALQQAEIGVTIEQGSDGRFDVGFELDSTRVNVTANSPEKSPERTLIDSELI